MRKTIYKWGFAHKPFKSLQKSHGNLSVRTQWQSIEPLKDSHSHLCSSSTENRQYKLAQNAQVLWRPFLPSVGHRVSKKTHYVETTHKSQIRAKPTETLIVKTSKGMPTKCWTKTHTNLNRSPKNPKNRPTPSKREQLIIQKGLPKSHKTRLKNTKIQKKGQPPDIPK